MLSIANIRFYLSEIIADLEKDNPKDKNMLVEAAENIIAPENFIPYQRKHEYRASHDLLTSKEKEDNPYVHYILFIFNLLKHIQFPDSYDPNLFKAPFKRAVELQYVPALLDCALYQIHNKNLEKINGQSIEELLKNINTPKSWYILSEYYNSIDVHPKLRREYLEKSASHDYGLALYKYGQEFPANNKENVIKGVTYLKRAHDKGILAAAFVIAESCWLLTGLTSNEKDKDNDSYIEDVITYAQYALQLSKNGRMSYLIGRAFGLNRAADYSVSSETKKEMEEEVRKKRVSNDKQCLMHLEDAVKANYFVACFFVFECYEQGTGCEKDIYKAYDFLRKYSKHITDIDVDATLNNFKSMKNFDIFYQFCGMVTPDRLLSMLGTSPDVNVVDEDGTPLLNFAFVKTNYPVDVLLDYGADIFKPDSKGITVFDLVLKDTLSKKVASYGIWVEYIAQTVYKEQYTKLPFGKKREACKDQLRAIYDELYKFLVKHPDGSFGLDTILFSNFKQELSFLYPGKEKLTLTLKEQRMLWVSFVKKQHALKRYKLSDQDIFDVICEYLRKLNVSENSNQTKKTDAPKAEKTFQSMSLTTAIEVDPELLRKNDELEKLNLAISQLKNQYIDCRSQFEQTYILSDIVFDKTQSTVVTSSMSSALSLSLDSSHDTVELPVKQLRKPEYEGYFSKIKLIYQQMSDEIEAVKQAEEIRRKSLTNNKERREKVPKTSAESREKETLAIFERAKKLELEAKRFEGEILSFNDGKDFESNLFNLDKMNVSKDKLFRDYCDAGNEIEAAALGKAFKEMCQGYASCIEILKISYEALLDLSAHYTVIKTTPKGTSQIARDNEKARLKAERRLELDRELQKLEKARKTDEDDEKNKMEQKLEDERVMNDNARREAFKKRQDELEEQQKKDNELQEFKERVRKQALAREAGIQAKVLGETSASSFALHQKARPFTMETSSNLTSKLRIKEELVALDAIVKMVSEAKDPLAQEMICSALRGGLGKIFEITHQEKIFQNLELYPLRLYLLKGPKLIFKDEKLSANEKVILMKDFISMVVDISKHLGCWANNNEKFSTEMDSKAFQEITAIAHEFMDNQNKAIPLKKELQDSIRLDEEVLKKYSDKSNDVCEKLRKEAIGYIQGTLGAKAALLKKHHYPTFRKKQVKYQGYIDSGAAYRHLNELSEKPAEAQAVGSVTKGDSKSGVHKPNGR